MDEADLMALEPPYLEEIANECAVAWEVEDSDWLGVGIEGVGLVAAPACDQPHARLDWGEGGQVVWQRVEPEETETALSRRVRESRGVTRDSPTLCAIN